MDLEIGDIHVSIEGDEWDQAEITRLVEWHLTQAFEQISRQGAISYGIAREIESLYLPDVDWESEPDKTAKLVEMILDALESKL